MLVNELKNEIKKYDKKELEFIIVSLYKRIPKKVKEEYDIDSYIKNIDINKKTDVVKKEILFDEIYNEIIYFIECIDLGYYCSLNRVISKKDRSTWRFKVKRFYKELNKISPDSENGSIATSLLIELFKRLSRGTSILLFTNWNTFGASGIEQRDYYDVLIKRITFNGLTKESLKECVDLISVDNDPNGYSLFSAFINNLKTIDSINISIDLLKEKIISLKEELSNTKNGTDSYYINKNIKDEFDKLKVPDSEKYLDGIEYKFYEDDKFEYYYTSQKTAVVRVYFKNGENMTVEEALKQGKITMNLLDEYGVEYLKKEK